MSLEPSPPHITTGSRPPTRNDLINEIRADAPVWLRWLPWWLLPDPPAQRGRRSR
jgi:hypothetical protein